MSLYVIKNNETGYYLALINQCHKFTGDLDKAILFRDEVDAVKKIGDLVSRGSLKTDFQLYSVVPIVLTETWTPPAKGKPLTFQWFQHVSAERSVELMRQCPDGNDWTHGDWGNALAGEVGELCNVLKKIRRGWTTDGTLDDLVKDLAEELGDVVAYAALIADRFDIDLGGAVAAKFNEVSERYGSAFHLETAVPHV